MSRVCRMFLGRIVLEIDPGQCALLVGEQVVLIVQVVLPRLEQDAVEVELANQLGRDVANSIGEPKRPPASAVARAARHDRQEELDGRVRQVEQVVSVDVPRQDAYRSHIGSGLFGGRRVFDPLLTLGLLTSQAARQDPLFSSSSAVVMTSPALTPDG